MKLHRMAHDSSFLGGSFNNRDNLRTQFNLEEKDSPNTLKDDFFSRIDPSIFMPVAPETGQTKNKLSFSSIEINKLFPPLVYRLS